MLKESLKSKFKGNVEIWKFGGTFGNLESGGTRGTWQGEPPEASDNLPPLEVE